MEFSFGQLMAIVGGVFTLSSFAFGWIIFLIRRGSRAAVYTLKEDSELGKRIVILETDMVNTNRFIESMPKAAELVGQAKDIEYLKKEQEGFSSKIQDFTNEIGGMRVSIQELKGRFDNFGERLIAFEGYLSSQNSTLISLDKKIDMIVAGIKK